MSEIPLFTFEVTKAQVKRRPNSSVVQFGDGYSQDIPNGINSVLDNWSLSFKEVLPSVADAIDEFLKERKGSYRFYWITPKGEKLLFVCKEWELIPQEKNYWDITATFEQRTA